MLKDEGTMWAFFVGALVGIVALVAKDPTQFSRAEHKIQGLVVAAGMGAVVYGTALFLISLLF